MRGGFRSWEGAEAFLNLRRIIYNFVNPQQNLNGKTPAEMADIKLKLGRNRLLGLIEWITKVSRQCNYTAITLKLEINSYLGCSRPSDIAGL